MIDAAGKVYSFAGFHLNPGERAFYDAAGTPLQLAPKVFDTLQMLVANAGRVLSKEKMLAEIWADSFVEVNNLAQNISILRRTLGETRENRFIETVPKFGYRFVAPVEEEGEESELVERTRARIYFAGEELAVSTAGLGPGVQSILGTCPPETQYVQNGDVNIAYQVVGKGETDIVFVMGWVSHLEYFWRHPLFAGFLRRLASFSRLILFDKRGTGLSDRVPIGELPTLEQRMDDLRAVMDAVGSEKAVLFGISEGGPMCALFAATYPERTRAVINFGTYAKRVKDDDYPWGPSLEQREAFFELMLNEWGGPVGIDERAPSMANDPDFRQWWAEYLRMGASPGAAVALTKMNAEIDVRHVLPLVRVPTLIMHRRDDRCLKVEEGRYVASLIPNSRFVELSGDDHLPFVGDQEQVLGEIERFVHEAEATDEYDRVLATVVNVRIADMEAEGGKRGADEWEAVRTRAREYVRKQLDVFKGRLVSLGNGEVLAAFDGPARAIRCAASIVGSAERIGVAVRAGVHTGECDVVGGTYGGFAVDLARRIAAESEPGRVIVSRTVKDLVAGSGLEFDDYGVKRFDGADGEWRLFSVK